MKKIMIAFALLVIILFIAWVFSISDILGDLPEVPEQETIVLGLKV